MIFPGDDGMSTRRGDMSPVCCQYRNAVGESVFLPKRRMLSRAEITMLAAGLMDVTRMLLKQETCAQRKTTTTKTKNNNSCSNSNNSGSSSNNNKTTAATAQQYQQQNNININNNNSVKLCGTAVLKCVNRQSDRCPAIFVTS
ncbi:hypothetical protein PoB_000388500 [Plakobranchus ocellatus]|uniref:Uncharacterized protein n=1 Tax=Plakobranchus ocellatus TaxID=259542 RepID=A0AAV3Y3Y9_9GAST|nr:hypothetical protein PoB_000388500 [Plakobranchus ocellatus]